MSKQVDESAKPSKNIAQTDYAQQASELDAAEKRSELSTAEQELDKLDDVYDGAQSFASSAQTAWNAVKSIGTLLQSTDAVQNIDNKLDDFTDSIPVFIDALDEVSRLHPFINVAVLAFKAVYTLERTRSENDKKIKLLYLEMKDMMSILLRLKDMKDIKKDSQDRLEHLAKSTSEDIRDCANACDTYSKKKLVVKFVKGPIWEQRLASFTGVFTMRRSQFEFELSLRSAEVGTESYIKMVGVQNSQKNIEAKINTMLQIFKTLLSPDQIKIQNLAIEKSRQDEAQMRRLMSDWPQLVESTNEIRKQANEIWNQAKPSRKDIEDALEDLRSSSADTNEDERKNMDRFEMKFSLKKQQILNEMEHLVVREADRVISAINAGPYEKIIDKDIYAIWKEGGWKGGMNVQHFVSALRDYYQEKVESRKQAQRLGKYIETDPDDWALTYIDGPYLQPILEAFNDVATGLITISGVNKFTAARPRDWSLRRWLAFWAIGWYASTRVEILKIKILFNKMFGMLPEISPENRIYTDKYLDFCWKLLFGVIAAVEYRDVPNGTGTQFASYVEAEEKRLQANLNGIRYDIDELDALSLVTGPGRIEKHFFPLVRLMLEHHLKLFHIAKTRALNTMELTHAGRSFLYIMRAVYSRYNDLKSTFLNQNRDLKQLFMVYSYGFYKYLHEPSELWTTAIKYMDFIEEKDNEILEMPNPEETLLYLENDTDIDYPPYEESEDYSTIIAKVHAPGVHPLSGKWSLLLYENQASEIRVIPLTEYSIIPAEPAVLNGDFQCTGKLDTGATLSGYGSCEEKEGNGLLTVRLVLWASSTKAIKFYLSGTFDPDYDTMSGNAGPKEDPVMQRAYFILKRTPGEILRLRPAPISLKNNKAKALWTFARLAVLEQIRKHFWSWSYFKNRRNIREKYIEFVLSSGFRNRERRLEFSKHYELVAPHDATFYNLLVRSKMRKLTSQIEYFCDACEERLLGDGRIICLDCESTKDLTISVDFCGKQSCLETSNFPFRSDLTKLHTMTHDIVKTRKTVFMRQFVKFRTDAKEAIMKAHSKMRVSFDASIDTAWQNGEATASTNTSSIPALNCALCRKGVRMPCWYCIDCSGYFFVCIECDRTGGFEVDGHKKDHTLARWMQSCENSTEVMSERVSSLIQLMNDRLLQAETAKAGTIKLPLLFISAMVLWLFLCMWYIVVLY